MGGGLTQLVLSGQMDSYININPCINYYKYVYNRHVNFSMENKRIDSEGGTWDLNNPTDTKKYTFRIRRLGDLISNMYLCFNLPDIYSTDEHRFRWINNIGHNIILSATIYGSGSVIIDRIYGDWMNVWNELTNKDGIEYNKLIGNIPELCGPSNNSTRYTIKSNVLFNKTYPSSGKIRDTNNPSIRGRLLQVPLNFWFTRNPSLALPLYKLQQQFITVEVEFNNIEKLYQVWCDKLKLYVSPYFYKIIYGLSNFNITNFINKESYLNCYLDITYIFLESVYRSYSFKNESIIKYVVEYVTRNVKEGISYKDSFVTSDAITANNHIKELIWIFRRPDIELNFNIYDNYTASHLYNENMGILEKAEITWADTIIRTNEAAYYYNNIQPYQYHTNVPRTGIYCYSFSLFPEKIMSAGSYNNQMINTKLNITIDSSYKTKDQFKYLFDLMEQKGVPYDLKKKDDVKFDLIIFSKATSVFSINSGSGNFIWK